MPRLVTTPAHPHRLLLRARSCKLQSSSARRATGRIDGLVNNAGIALNVGIEDDDAGCLNAMWEVNVKGPLRLIRRVALS
jgi:NADP-dependent 3-hydroxy acid dehydrogenase YdfG